VWLALGIVAVSFEFVRLESVSEMIWIVRFERNAGILSVLALLKMTTLFSYLSEVAICNIGGYLFAAECGEDGVEVF
jgi:hypothetical protein